MPTLTSWTTWKATCVTLKNLNNQYVDLGDRLLIWGPEANGDAWAIELQKLVPDPNNPGQTMANPDVTDFTANVKPACNFAIGVKPAAFATSDYEFMPNMVQESCQAGGSKSVLFKITENCRLNGGKLITDGNAVFGDWVDVALIDHDNNLGYGADFLLKQWIPKWGVDWKACGDLISVPYVGTPPVGMYLKFTYHSVGGSAVGFLVNYLLHRPI